MDIVKTIVSATTGLCASALTGMAANIVVGKYVQGLPLPAKIAWWAVGSIGVIGISEVVHFKVMETMDEILD